MFERWFRFDPQHLGDLEEVLLEWTQSIARVLPEGFLQTDAI